MTVDAQLVRLHRRRTLGVIVRPRYAKYALREPKKKAPVMLLDKLTLVDCCAGVTLYAP
jgi:hypothetical protein